MSELPRSTLTDLPLQGAGIGGAGGFQPFAGKFSLRSSRFRSLPGGSGRRLPGSGQVSALHRRLYRRFLPSRRPLLRERRTRGTPRAPENSLTDAIFLRGILARGLWIGGHGSPGPRDARLQPWRELSSVQPRHKTYRLHKLMHINEIGVRSHLAFQ